jgi:hypothetical protein
MHSLQDFISQSKLPHSNEWVYKEFIASHIHFLQQRTANKQQFNHDAILLLDYIEEIRGMYFMSSNTTIDPIYQSLCKIAIKIIIKTKWLWVENYLRYFDPDDPYRLRMEALCSFRLLTNPKNQIAWAFQTVLTKLHQSLSQDISSLLYAREILKEYIDKLFAIVYTTPNQRSKWYATFISYTQEEYLVRTQDQELISWLENYDTIVSLDKIIHKIPKVSDVTPVQQAHVSEALDIVWYKYEIQQLTDQVANQKQQIDMLTVQLQSVQHSNQAISQLYEQIQTYQSQIQQLNDENGSLKNQLATYHAPVETIQENPPVLQSITDRSLYRIDVIWWSPKVMKKYKDIQKSIDLRPLWLDWKQFEIICDYQWQKKLKARDIQNKLLMGTTDIILAIQTDHETELANLIKEWTFADQITVFAEDQAFIWQSLSNERFIHYLNLALEKYERVERNVF